MVDITDEQVAQALHTDVAELPTGAQSDIDAAEIIVGEQVEPYATNGDLVERCAIYVACAFITGTEGERPISSIQRESATVSYDTDSSDEPSDYWARAQAIDPTNRLGKNTASFSAHGSW